MHRGPGVHNRGRKRILEDHQCTVIEVVEDVNFSFTALSHYRITKNIGLTNESERVI